MTNVYKIGIQTDKNSSDYTDYSDYLQLPFIINERSDERYDSGSFTLRKTPRLIPFDIESKVKIEIYKNNELVNSYVMQIESDNIEYFYIGPRRYCQHNVSIIELTKKYDNIYLPDFTITNPATKTIVMPYETTQVDYSLNTSSTGLVSKYVLETSSQSESDNLWMHFYRAANFSINSHLYTTSLPNFNNGLDKLPDTYYIKGQKIELPVPYSTDKNASVKFKLDTYYDSNGYGTTNALVPVYSEWDIHSNKSYNFQNEYVLLEYRYGINNSYYDLGNFEINLTNGKIRNFNSVSDKFSKEYDKTTEKDRIYLDSSFPEVEANTEVYIGIRMKFITPSLVNLDTGKDLTDFLTSVFQKMFNTNWGATKDCSIISESLRKAINIYYYDKPSLGGSFINDEIRGVLNTLNDETYAFPPDNDDDAIAFQKLFYTYGKHDMNVGMTHSYGEVDDITEKIALYGGRTVDRLIASMGLRFTVGVDNPTLKLELIDPGEYKTVKDLLEKINIMMEPEDRFNIDLSQTEILETFIPERIYSNRNVSEILFDIASLVSAYPYLDDNNILTFKKLSSNDNPLYEDIGTVETVAYNFDNNINTYTTNVSNMISTPDTLRMQYSYWPDKYNFAYPNGDWKNSSISPDTNQIEISNSSGIYFLKSIKVKNCLKQHPKGFYGPDTVIDITNFCPEETYYNTLYVKDEAEASNTNKSNCIFWTKGSNIINLDNLELKEKTAIFGTTDPTAYRIQRAVFYAASSQLSSGLVSIADNVNENTAEYQFQICYVDSINGLIKTKKFNQDVDYEISSNYNQTDNNINSLDWMNTAQINMLRRGNTEVSKKVYIKNLDELPRLGELKYDQKNEKYLADSLDFTFDNNIVSVNINYTKNYNKIDPSVSLDKDYRQFEIYGKESVSRNIRIDRFVYMETDSSVKPNNKEEITSSKYDFTGAFRIDGRQKTPSYMALFFKDYKKNPLKYYRMISSGFSDKEEVGGLLIPINYASSGNSIILQGGASDNYAIGYYADTSENIPYINILGEQKESGARRIKEARYVDDLGEAEYVSIYILTDDAAKNVFNSSTFPKISIDENTVKNLSYDYEENIHIKKDNREKLNFVYQIHFLTHDKHLKWNPALCKYFFYDQEDKNELFISKSDSSIYNSFVPSYYNLKYDIGNDSMIRYLRDGSMDVIDKSHSEFDKEAEISSNTISESNEVSSDFYHGYALVYPKTFEVIFHYDKPVKKGEDFIKPSITFKFYKNKI